MDTLANAAARLKAKARPRPHRRCTVPALWLLSDAERLPDPRAAIAGLPRGSGVILRHPDPAARRRMAEAVRPICRARGLLCLVAQDWRLAAAVGADGLHLPERQARMGAAAGALLWRRTRRALLTVSAHGRGALLRGARLRPDAFLLAPAFATASHPDATPLGPIRVAAAVRGTLTPVIALGGLTPLTAKRLAHSGIGGLAAVGAFSEKA
jgi:thiamine-phosphate pyrophosphorylase